MNINPEVLAPAPVWLRAADLALDFVFRIIFGFLFGVVLGIVLLVLNSSDFLDRIPSFVLGISSFFLYYLIFEGIWTRTPAKFITKLKVVTDEGTKPNLLDIFIRTSCRFIPLEAFSFVGKEYPIGLHDDISSTLVVPVQYTTEDVLKMDHAKIAEIKTSGGKKFLLVVLTIMFYLGSLALLGVVALNGAHEQVLQGL